MFRLKLPLGANKKEIDPAQVENLFAAGLSQKEIAKEIGIHYTNLSSKINNSVALLSARERGLRKSKAHTLGAKEGNYEKRK